MPVNMVDYAENKFETFAESPFNPVDSLILCQLSYIKFEVQSEVINKSAAGGGLFRPSLTLKDLYRSEYFRQMFTDGITDRDNRRLFAAVAASPRYRDIVIREIVSEFDKEEGKQFALVNFALDKDTDYVAFRGTDGAMVGWKEDFELSFKEEIPSQKRALEYLNSRYGRADQAETDEEDLGREGENAHESFRESVKDYAKDSADRIVRSIMSVGGSKKKLYVGGHSKGGNLAVYAGIMADDEVHSKLISVISHDGPGFKQDVLDRLVERQEECGIDVIKLVPQGSVIGMLLGSQGEYRVVQSDGVGVNQHAAFTWQIEGDDFVYREGLSESGERAKRALAEWVKGADQAKREAFTEAVFNFFEENGIETVNDLKNMNYRDIPKLISSFRGLDEESRSVIISMLKALAEAAVRS